MKTVRENPRELRGLQIAKKHGNQIKRINEFNYEVLSQSGNGSYHVSRIEEDWICDCPDHRFRKVKCKHAYAVEFSLAFRREIQSNVIIQPISNLVCQYCSSDRIVKNAKRHNKYGDLQKYLCKECGKRFSINIGFEKMKASPQVITSAMQLYFTGESLRNVQRFLKLQGVNVSHVAVYKWIGKYIGLMENYLQRMKPKVSDTWRADELYLKVKGNMKYLFALMDDETRFWIAQEVSDSKYQHDARKQAFFPKRPSPIIQKPHAMGTVETLNSASKES